MVVNGKSNGIEMVNNLKLFKKTSKILRTPKMFLKKLLHLPVKKKENNVINLSFTALTPFMTKATRHF